MSINIETVNAAGFSMRYFKFGSGEKTFVILPGLSVQSVMDAAEIIADAYKILAEEFTVYVFDRRSEIPETYTVYDMAEDTVAAFRALNLKDAYVFGASQGGMLSMVLALRYPELVKKLMLGSSAARITDRQAKAISEWINLAEKRERVKLSLEMGRVLYPENLFEQFRETLEKIGETITDGELAKFVILAKGTKGFSVADKLADIECPVLSLGVSDDKVLPGAAEEIIEIMKDKENFESFTYTGCGHAAFDTAPDYKEKLFAFCLK